MADAASSFMTRGSRSRADRRPRRAGIRLVLIAALAGGVGAGALIAPARVVAADKAPKGESTDKGGSAGKLEKNEPGAKPASASGAAGAPGTEAATSASKGSAGGAPAEDGTSSRRRGPPLLRHSQAKRPAADPPAAVKPGEDPPPPSPLTMDALRQDMKRGKDSGGISPDAPARTKVEQVLAEMVKTRAALRDDTSRLENLTLDGLSAGETGAAGAGPAAPGAPGQPPQKNPLDVLAKALRGIKPDQAAPIVARIDRRLAATVLLKMPPVDAGKIMGALKPDVAAEIATEIAMRAKPQHPLVGMGAKR